MNAWGWATCLLPHAQLGHRKCRKWLWIQTVVSRSGWAHSCIEAGSSPDLTGVRAGAVLWTGPVLASPGSWPRGLCWVVTAGPRWSPCGTELAGGVLGKLTRLAEPHRGQEAGSWGEAWRAERCGFQTVGHHLQCTWAAGQSPASCVSLKTVVPQRHGARERDSAFLLPLEASRGCWLGARCLSVIPRVRVPFPPFL